MSPRVLTASELGGIHAPPPHRGLCGRYHLTDDEAAHCPSCCWIRAKLTLARLKLRLMNVQGHRPPPKEKR